VRPARPHAATCARWRGEKLTELERRIAEMTAMRDELRNIIDEWDTRLDATPEGEPARLLERLGEKS
jgi:hypothetical protein